MDLEKRIDDLIEAGWHVLDSEYDEAALVYWKKTASEFFIDFLGRRHSVTESFIRLSQAKYGYGLSENSAHVNRH